MGADLGESASLVDSLFGFIFDEMIRVAFKGLGNPFDDRITSLFTRRIVLNRYRLVRAGMVNRSSVSWTWVLSRAAEFGCGGCSLSVQRGPPWINLT